MKKRRPTIIDVGERAGVSKSTVARVLSGSKNVTPGAREAVLRAAKVIGYQRNDLAVSMRSGRSGLIGLVIPDIANPFWAEVARGAQDRAMSAGSSLLMFSSDWSSERETEHLGALIRARVDGFILNPISDSAISKNYFGFGIPSIFVGSTADMFPDQSSVMSDIRQGVELALNYLTQKGHGLPRLIVGPPKRLARAKFISAVNDFYIERDVDPTRLEVENGSYTVDGGRQAMNRLLENRAQAHLTVFVANDLMALGAILAVREAGLKCPDDVSVMGIDGIPAGALCDPGLTTVTKPARRIGLTAVELLLDGIDGKAGIGKTLLPCELTERNSVSDLTGCLLRSVGT